MAVEMKLKEIGERYGISGRTIQGYENLGLVKPYHKTQLGHLEYDTKTINKIIFINFLQNMGCSYHASKCLNCGKYIDCDAIYCTDCLKSH